MNFQQEINDLKAKVTKLEGRIERLKNSIEMSKTLQPIDARGKIFTNQDIKFNPEV
jgi:peptidoglycan hydrolase CwlO-like protein